MTSLEMSKIIFDAYFYQLSMGTQKEAEGCFKIL